MFVVKGDPPRQAVTYTRNGSFSVNPAREVLDSTGAKLQLLPVDANGNVTDRTLGGLYDLVLPVASPTDPTASMVNISVNLEGLVIATFADGTDQTLGKVALATFPAMEGLRPVGDAHWQSTGDSGPASIDGATNGPMGAIRSGALERSNVDITEELVLLIAAQRNFQANAKAIESASNITQSIININ
jgi:flagellar hook protein FlgE